MPNIFNMDRNFGPGRDRRRARREERRGERGERRKKRRKDRYEHYLRVKQDQPLVLTFNKGGVVKSGVTRYKDIYEMDNS